jgi:replication-associated recombination protein RarA
MNLKEKLFWEKFRPNTIKPEKGKIPIILLPRIRKLVENNLELNYMFHGTGGLGKSSLAKILSKDLDTLTINCSQQETRGIGVIDSLISDHIKNYTISFKNKRKSGDPYGQKCVILEEFNKATPDMRAALRFFIEEHSHVRFIATLNEYNKINRSDDDKALLSRFNIINFDPETQDEISYLKKQLLNYLRAISKAVNFEIDDKILNEIINRTFPNFRSAVQLLQEITLSGDFDSYLEKKEHLNLDVYTFIMNGENKTNQNFFYVVDNFPREKTEDLLNILSRPFFKYLVENYEEIIFKNGFKILDLMKEFNAEYTTTIDPEMHLITYIGKIKELVNI